MTGPAAPAAPADPAGPADLPESARRRPAAGRLIAAAGAAVTLGSMFLPWYSVSLRIRSYADLSVLALARIDGAGLQCSTPSGSGCHVSAQVGALAAGVWDWRTLIAVGAAAVLAVVVARAIRPAQPPSAQPANARPAGARSADTAPARVKPTPWQVLAAFTAGTVALVTAAIVVSPVAQPGLPGPPLDLSSSPSYGAIVGLAGSLIALAGALLAAPWATRMSHRPAAAAASRLPAPNHPA